MVKPAKGAIFQQQIQGLLETQKLKFVAPPKNTGSTRSSNQKNEPENNNNDDKPWWNVT